jgi:hypothetical protein
LIKVFENFDFPLVGRMQSLLESHDIPTFLKNQFTSSVMGEVPFVEVVPQLFILNEADLTKATRLLAQEQVDVAPVADWVCSDCGAEVEGQFGSCWNCGLVHS